MVERVNSKQLQNVLEKNAIATPFKTGTTTGLVESVSGKQLQNALGNICDSGAFQNRYKNALAGEYSIHLSGAVEGSVA